MVGFVDRMIRAARLDVQLYEEVGADPQALMQAMGVVLLSSLAGGLRTSARGACSAWW